MRRVSLVTVILTALVMNSSLWAMQAKAGPEKASASVGTPINLNTATVAQLESLPGIGAATAKRIVEHRQKIGAFKKVEELMNVKGIGEKSFLKLKPLVTVAAEKPERSGEK